jgi:large subunit ribosomal protein L13
MKQRIRKIIELDATGQAVGRLSTQIAMILMGKHSPDYDRSLDTGDKVNIINADKVIFTGRKLAQKDYYHHSMHPGGIKRTPMKKVFLLDPSEVIRHAVNGMVPKNRQREELMKRLTFTV